MRIHHQRAGKGDGGTDLIFERQTQRNEVAGIVSVDPTGSPASVKIRVNQAEADKRHKVHPVWETEVVLRGAGYPHLCEITGRSEKRQSAERKVMVEVIVEMEPQGKYGPIRRARPNPQIRAEAPTILLSEARPQTYRKQINSRMPERTAPAKIVEYQPGMKIFRWPRTLPQGIEAGKFAARVWR